MSRLSDQARRRILVTAIAGAVVCGCGLAGGSPAGAADYLGLDALSEAADSSPAAAFANRATGLHSMYEVVSVAADDVVAVGVGGADVSARAKRWDGRTWRSIRPEGEPFSEMWGVGAISPTDVWGVGNAQKRSMAQHWDGDSWTPVDTPPVDPGMYLDNLESVDGARSRDAWAVGFTLVCLCANERPLVEHWDGRSWAKVEVDLPYGNTEGVLYGVSVITPDDAWAVGNTDTPRRAPLAMHWDGETWTSVEIDLADASTLRDVHALATDDVWAVGSRAGTGVSLLHWDGNDWTRYPSHTGQKDWLVDSMWSVHAIAADDVWAVGGYGNDLFEPERLRILHWDGARWTKVPAPNPGDNENRLYAVSGTSPDDVWAVGNYSDDGDNSHSLYLHWDGQEWTKARSGRHNGELAP